MALQEEYSMFFDQPMATRLATILFACMMFSGCYHAHNCGTEEFCNYDDDDCDGKVDEGFIGPNGVYNMAQHCGSCGVNCGSVFPTAATTSCNIDGEVPICELLTCPEGSRQVGESACAPNSPSLCLTCTTDQDCTVRSEGARCLPLEGSSGSRCFDACETNAACPTGFECDTSLNVCQPQSSGQNCDCTPETVGAEFACTLMSRSGQSCVGTLLCEPTGLGMCMSALDEVCNGLDDNCDNQIDETFRNENGTYVSALHCGACGVACAAPGPNMTATCGETGIGTASCNIVCNENFVDVNRITADGCECERWDGIGPPPDIGGDIDCDGIIDDVNTFIFVSERGSDTNPGTQVSPMRTITNGSARAQAEGKSLLVAGGTYIEQVNLRSGVSVFGGYRNDFRDRDVERFPTTLQTPDNMPGLPALVCNNIAVAQVDGFILKTRDQTQPGRGSTTVWIQNCGEGVRLSHIQIFAAEAADGIHGAGANENLQSWGLASLLELDGTNGTDGRGEPRGALSCERLAAGHGGVHMCPGRGVGPSINVSGGRGADADCPNLGCFNGSACGNSGCTDFTFGGVCDIDAAIAAATPNPSAENGFGSGAGLAGESTYNAPTNRGTCNFCDGNPTLARDGVSGTDGNEGLSGMGGLGCEAGRLILNADGTLHVGGGIDGTDGQDGAGGGGASSGAGYAVIGGTESGCVDHPGGSGGGGGSGGCGAPHGSAGTGGGTSTGILIQLAPSFSAGPQFEMVRIITANGGDGGDGGIGARGGRGGVGGNGGNSTFWCSFNGGRGGDGGSGGAGGGGGGGCGGGSHGVAIDADAAPAYTSSLSGLLTIDRSGSAGRAGRGGFAPSASGTDGSAGGADDVFVF